MLTISTTAEKNIVFYSYVLKIHGMPSTIRLQPCSVNDLLNHYLLMDAQPYLFAQLGCRDLDFV